jgi:hypothetical protein
LYLLPAIISNDSIISLAVISLRSNARPQPLYSSFIGYIIPEVDGIQSDGYPKNIPFARLTNGIREAVLDIFALEADGIVELLTGVEVEFGSCASSRRFSEKHRNETANAKYKEIKIKIFLC